MLKTLEVVIVKEPKISAKLLCEYAEASPLARTRIIKSCKIKDPAVVSISQRYNNAQQVISDYMTRLIGFNDVLTGYANDLKKQSKNFSGKKADNKILCAEAIEKFAKMGNVIDRMFNDFIINNTSHLKGQKVKINGVDISIRPEMLLSVHGGLTEVGFVKLIFSKSKEIDQTIAQGVAALGRLYYREIKKQDFRPDMCFVIDVFSNKIYTASKNDKRILDNYKACCTEIADRWDRIF